MPSLASLAEISERTGEGAKEKGGMQLCTPMPPQRGTFAAISALPFTRTCCEVQIGEMKVLGFQHEQFSEGHLSSKEILCTSRLKPASDSEFTLRPRLLPHLTLENLIAGASPSSLMWVFCGRLLRCALTPLRSAIPFNDLLMLRLHGPFISLQGHGKAVAPCPPQRAQS